MSSPAAVLRLAGIQAILAAAIGTALWFSYPAWRLGRVSEHLRQQYPDVAQISTSDLAAWLASANPVKPVILDVRTPEEFAVSHLIEAHRIDAGGELKRDDRPDDLARVIAVYCATGDRSTAFARRLQRAGHLHVFALEGGIVRWANEGRPMTNGHGLVSRVRPPDEKAARFLKAACRADAAAAR